MSTAAAVWTGPVFSNGKLCNAPRRDVEKLLAVWDGAMRLWPATDDPQQADKSQVLRAFRDDIQETLWAGIIDPPGPELPQSSVSKLMALAIMHLKGQADALKAAKAIVKTALQRYPADRRKHDVVCPREDLLLSLTVLKGLTRVYWQLLEHGHTEKGYGGLLELAPIKTRWDEYVQALHVGPDRAQTTAHQLAADELARIEARAGMSAELLACLEKPRRVL